MTTRRFVVLTAAFLMIVAASPAHASPVCIKDLKVVTVCTPW